MAYIKFKTHMPEWFYLEKYIKEPLSATIILPNLVYRKILYGFLINFLTVEVVNDDDVYGQGFIYELKGNLKFSNTKFNGDSTSVRKDIINFMFNNLMNNPLRPYSNKYQDNIYYSPINMCFSIFMDSITQYTESKPIKELSAVEIASNYFVLPHVYRNFIKSEILAFGGDVRNEDNEEELLFDWENRDGLTREIVEDCRGSLFSLNVKNMKNNTLSGNPLLEVNLNFTNAFLLRQFEKWLNKKRTQIAKNNISYEYDLLDADPDTLVNKINEYRIFPYLDLCL